VTLKPEFSVTTLQHNYDMINYMTAVFKVVLGEEVKIKEVSQNQKKLHEK
jgi:hypothetical protein